LPRPQFAVPHASIWKLLIRLKDGGYRA